MRTEILVCGGAGYIGAHMCEMLADRGFSVVVLDNLSTGSRGAVRWGTLIEADLRDANALDQAFAAYRFAGVIHFAAKSLVGESVREPGTYYDNNVTGTLNLLRTVVRHGNPPLVFSSTAAVYGEPQRVPIDEDHPTNPVNPYGRSKLTVEGMLADFRRAHALRSASLRYFNAAGASASGLIGEAHEPETHLIPNTLRAALRGEPVTVFGQDYATPDGSCLRDYVHVTDLCEAHLAALDYLQHGGPNLTLNLGSGCGYTVFEVISAAEAVCGRPIARQLAARRDGDPASLVASVQRAQEMLAWKPRHSDLHTIVSSAWSWHKAQAAAAKTTS